MVSASTRGRVLRGVEHIPRLPGVAVHLLDQGWQVGKLLFVAQLRDELDLDATTVQVAVKIEQVCLQQRFDAANRGTGAETRKHRPWTDAPEHGRAPCRERVGQEMKIY